MREKRTARHQYSRRVRRATPLVLGGWGWGMLQNKVFSIRELKRRRLTKARPEKLHRVATENGYSVPGWTVHAVLSYGSQDPRWHGVRGVFRNAGAMDAALLVGRALSGEHRRASVRRGNPPADSLESLTQSAPRWGSSGNFGRE